MDLLDLWQSQPGAVMHGAKVLGTVYETLQRLAAFYRELMETALLKAAPDSPARRALLNKEVPVALIG